MVKDENKTIMVNEIEYFLNDFTNEQQIFLNHVQDIDRKIANSRFNLDQLMVGREAFAKQLADSLETPLEKVEAAE